MRKLSQVETACLLAILIIVAIGCEKSKHVKNGDMITIGRNGKVDTGVIANPVQIANFRPLDYAIRDTDYYDNNPYIPCTTGLCLGDEMSVCQTDYYGYESKCWVQIAMYHITQHSEIQPGY